MPKGKNRQLTLEDRIFIEDRIKTRDSLSEAARRLGASASTVSREIKRNRVPESPGYQVAHENLCRKAAECTVAGLCGTGCLAPCRKCRKGPSTCNALCPDFAPRPCPQLDRPPFCCNTCYRRYGGGCGHPTLFYDGRSADELARRRLSESRGGIGITREELLAMDELVTPLARRGQSPSAIWATHSDELPVGVRTYYTYVDAGIMTCANIDLPKRVRFRPRKGKEGQAGRPRRGGRPGGEALLGLPRAARRGQGGLLADGLRGGAGRRVAGAAHAVLPPLALQLVMLLTRKDRDNVADALDSLESLLGGPAGFSGVFGTILTDRGAEFTDPDKIELSPRGSAGVACTTATRCSPPRRRSASATTPSSAESSPRGPRWAVSPGPTWPWSPATSTPTSARRRGGRRRLSWGWPGSRRPCSRGSGWSSSHPTR